MAYDPQNVFARILRGELPCVKIFEDAETLSFMDIMPAVEGHTLVIPKDPGETIFDLSANTAGALMRTTQKVAGAVKTAIGCPGVMLLQVNGAEAGQTVPHAHFHILPRWDGLSLVLHGRDMVQHATLERIAAKIRAAL